jgi:hypothetical protein
LSGPLLNAQVERFRAQLFDSRQKFFAAHFSYFLGFHDVISGGNGTGGRGLEAFHKAAANSQFVGSETECFLGLGFCNSGKFKHDVTGKNNRHPKFRGALTFTHPGFWWTGRYGFVRKYPDEKFTPAFQETVDGNTAGFNLIVFDPFPFQGLKSEFTEIDFVSASGIPGSASTLGFPILGSVGH